MSVLDLTRAGINFLAIDFDLTLVDTHTEGRWPGSPSELAARVRPNLRHLMNEAMDAGIHVAIVTLSPQVNIRYRLPQLCEIDFFAGAIDISSASIDISCQLRYGIQIFFSVVEYIYLCRYPFVEATEIGFMLARDHLRGNKCVRFSNHLNLTVCLCI